MSDETEIIRDPAQRGPMSGWQQVVQAISNFILPTHRELITMLRTPTPLKISKAVQVDANGILQPVELYRCTMAAEAWLHRISISSPEYPANAPLQTGTMLCVGTTSGEPIFWLPLAGDVAPIIIAEGRLSAPHLNSGEAAVLTGSGLPVGSHFRFDLQIALVTGLSQQTPRTHSPADIEASDEAVTA